MNAKISMFVICVKAIIYLLSYNMHDCTFKRARNVNWHKYKKSLKISILNKELLELFRSINLGND